MRCFTSTAVATRTTSRAGCADGDWDLGYEVCLYRDVLWQKGGLSAVGLELPPKRTFDLCLFGERALVVIEAKVCGARTARNPC